MKLFTRLDKYIIKKFLGTYVFSIILIISIAVVFDFNDNVDKFTTNNAPWEGIVFTYYANFIPFYSNLFSALFVCVGNMIANLLYGIVDPQIREVAE